jgi:hypothetical protein
MGLTGFNKARRERELLAMATVPLESLVTVVEPVKVTVQPEVVPMALQTINGAIEAVDITVIPTIGKGAAELVFNNRPEGGYNSFDNLWELNPSVLTRPFRTNKETVELWLG